MPEPAVVSAIQQALQGLRYGTVQLTIHDGRLVRVERIERIRLDAGPETFSEPTRPPGGREQTPS